MNNQTDKPIETWRFLYKCRRCGQIEGLICVHLEDVAHEILLAIIDNDHSLIRGQTRLVDLYDVHLCDDGSMGLSDLIGAVRDDGNQENDPHE
jgi:hypothetical protein